MFAQSNEEMCLETRRNEKEREQENTEMSHQK